MHGAYEEVCKILKQCGAETFLQTFEDNLIDDETLPFLSVDHLKDLLPRGIAIKVVAACSIVSCKPRQIFERIDAILDPEKCLVAVIAPSLQRKVLQNHYHAESSCVLKTGTDTLHQDGDPAENGLYPSTVVPFVATSVNTSVSGESSRPLSVEESNQKVRKKSIISEDALEPKSHEGLSFSRVRGVKRSRSWKSSETPLARRSFRKKNRQSFAELVSDEAPTPAPRPKDKCAVFNGPPASPQEKTRRSRIVFRKPASKRQKSNHQQVSITNGEILKQVLLSSDLGQAILSAYEQQNSLDKIHSQKLCDIILSKEFEGDFYRSLHRRDFEILIQSIVELFPNEKKSAYYNTRMSHCKRGKLFYKYEAKRVRHRQIESAQKEQTPPTDKREELVGKKNQTLIAALQSLKLNRDPEKTILYNWQCTKEYRSTNKKDTIEDYFNDYPCLRDSVIGPKLIYFDFILSHGTKEDEFFTNWCSVSDLLLRLARQYIEANDPQWMNYVQESGVNLLATDPEQKKLFGLMLLPYFFPIPAICGRKTRWKSSRIESANELIKIIPSADEIDSNLTEWKNLQLERRLPSHPLTVLIGSPLRIVGTFVLIGDQKYYFQSIFTAFDFCFKSFFVLNVRYPPEAVLPYMFIQNCIYKISSEKKYLRITELWNKLKYISDEIRSEDVF